ncbi:uncharacterized protein [Miscanthus floridulus]|uniref:uncharacterized protein n=1 Tax=Miscanthus floridulus TaxID=154761 RepID=UPI00345B1151
MAQIVFNHVGGKPPFLNGISLDYWKRKMKMYLGSINKKVWDETKNDFVILDPTNPTPREQENKQCNTMALNTIYNAIDSKVFEQIKDLERASEVWTRLEEIYEGTPKVKSAKLYILKDKLTSFMMKDDESIPEMFYRLQVIVNDLNSLGEKVNDDDVSHRFLMCIPPWFETLRLIIIRGGLKDITPNQVLGDFMTQETYRVEREGVDQEEDKKKKSIAFKAGASSKSKGKSKKEESSDDEEASDIDDEALALFVRKFGKFMKKKGYGARKRRDNYKNKDYVRRCYKCKSKDHIIADCPYNSDNDDDEKKEKKDKKEKKMIFKKKKKGGSYVVTWDSDASLDDDDSSDDEKKTSKKKAIASIAINNKSSLFDTPSTSFIAKATKVKYDESNGSDSESDDDDDEEHSKEDLMDMLEQAHTCFETKRKECKELRKKLQTLEQSFDEFNATHERLIEAHEKLESPATKCERVRAETIMRNNRVFQSLGINATKDILNKTTVAKKAVAHENSGSLYDPGDSDDSE